MLVAYNVNAALSVSSVSPSGAVVIAEACNLAAKDSSIFYAIKPGLIIASWKMGAHFGVRQEINRRESEYNREDVFEDVYYLSDLTVGTASFHDPRGEIKTLVSTFLKEAIPKWEHEWSGVVRQDEAYEIMDSLAAGDDIIESYAKRTLPEEMNEARKKWMRKELSDASKAKLGEILTHTTT